MQIGIVIVHWLDEKETIFTCKKMDDGKFLVREEDIYFGILQTNEQLIIHKEEVKYIKSGVQEVKETKDQGEKEGDDNVERN